MVTRRFVWETSRSGRAWGSSGDDGAGPLRTVPQSVGLKHWQGRADPASAAAFGQRTGAGLVVFGSVRQARGAVTLRATVMDVARNHAEPDLEIKGDTAAMGDLADSLGLRILQVLGRNRPIGAVRQVSIGSRSLPALKAFLSGEQFYRRGLAEDPAAPAADLIRVRFRSLSTLEEAARRYPGDPEVWLALGETRWHSPPPIGEHPASALEAFNRAISLDPGFAPAHEHTLNLAIRLNRPDLARKYAEAYLRLAPSDVNVSSIRLAASMLDPNRSHAPETARILDSIRPVELFRAGLEHLGNGADLEEAAIRILRALTRRTGNGADGWSDTLMYQQFLAVVLAYRGHLREAYAVDRRLLLDPNASPYTGFLDPFLQLALLGTIPDSIAAAHFGPPLRSSKPWSLDAWWGVPRSLRGLPWWLARNDRASLRRFTLRAGQEAGRQQEGVAQLRARYLHAAATAYLVLARADSAQALRLFQAIPDTLCTVADCYYQKLTQARLLNGLGQAREAAQVLDRWIYSGRGPSYVLGVLERGRIAENLGDQEKAKQSYQFVIDVWRRADPELQPYVAEARNGLPHEPRVVSVRTYRLTLSVIRRHLHPQWPTCSSVSSTPLPAAMLSSVSSAVAAWRWCSSPRTSSTTDWSP